VLLRICDEFAISIRDRDAHMINITRFGENRSVHPARRELNGFRGRLGVAASTAMDDPVDRTDGFASSDVGLHFFVRARECAIIRANSGGIGACAQVSRKLFKRAYGNFANRRTLQTTPWWITKGTFGRDFTQLIGNKQVTSQRCKWIDSRIANRATARIHDGWFETFSVKRVSFLQVISSGFTRANRMAKLQHRSHQTAFGK